MSLLFPRIQWRLAQWILILTTVAAFALLSKLAWWQWHRAEVKEAQLLQQANHIEQGPLSWVELRAAALAKVDGAELSGEAVWQKPAVWLLDNQLVNGQVGYDVVIPVLLDEQLPLLLVNLGWVAAPKRREELPELGIPTAFSLNGLLRTQLGGVLLGHNLENTGLWPERIQKIVFTDLASQLGQPLYEGIVYQQQSPYRYHYQSVVLSPQKHRAYALQWALLALAVCLIAAALWRKEF